MYARDRFGIDREDAWCRTHGYQPGRRIFGSARDTKTASVFRRAVLVNFLDNHDLPDFSTGRERDLARRAVLLLTWDGIPCIYYGTDSVSVAARSAKSEHGCWKSGARLSALRHRESDVHIHSRPERNAKGVRTLRRGDVKCAGRRTTGTSATWHLPSSAQSTRPLVVLNVSSSIRA